MPQEVAEHEARARAVVIEEEAPLLGTPAIVGSRKAEVDLFDVVLPDVRDVEVSCERVEGSASASRS